MKYIFLNSDLKNRYLQWATKNFVENYYFDRRKLSELKKHNEAEESHECRAADKTLKLLCAKNYLSNFKNTKESNEHIQIDFWGLAKFRYESDKYALVAID